MVIILPVVITMEPQGNQGSRKNPEEVESSYAALTSSKESHLSSVLIVRTTFVRGGKRVSVSKTSL